MPTSRTSASSPPPGGVRHQRLRRDASGGHGSGTSSALRRASRSPGATATSPRGDCAAVRTVRSYREAMRDFAAMGTSTSGTRASTSTLSSPSWCRSPPPRRWKEARKGVAKAGKKNSLRAFDRLVRVVDGEPRSISDPPLLVPASELVPEETAHELEGRLLELLRRYAREPRRRPSSPARQLPVRRSMSGSAVSGPRRGGADDGASGPGSALLQAKEAKASAAERRPRASGRKPRRAGGRGPAADAGLERHLPRLPLPR